MPCPSTKHNLKIAENRAKPDVSHTHHPEDGGVAAQEKQWQHRYHHLPSIHSHYCYIFTKNNTKNNIRRETVTC